MQKRYSTSSSLKSNQRIRTKLHDNLIEIRIESLEEDMDNNLSWETEIRELRECSEALAELFESVVDFFQYIQDCNHLKVDFEGGYLSVLLKNTLKNKQTYTEIAKIKLTPVKLNQYQDLTLQKILQICTSQPPISNPTIKSILSHLATHLLAPPPQPIPSPESPQPQPQPSPLPAHQKLDQILDPIINKIKITGEQAELMQVKVGSIFETVNQFEEKMRKEIAGVQESIKDVVGELKDYIETVKEGIDREIIRCENKYEVISLEFKDKMSKCVNEITDHKMYIKEMEISMENLREYITNLQTEILIQLGNKGQPNDKTQMKQKQNYGIQKYINTKTKYSNHFKFSLMQAQKIKGINGQFTILVGNQSLERKKTFTVKIKKAGIYPILLGIIDGRHRQQQNCQKTDQRIWFSSEGKWFDGQNESNSQVAFLENSIVTISVSLVDGKIWIQVNKKPAAYFACKLLKSKEILWFPCIWVAENGTTIEWIS